MKSWKKVLLNASLSSILATGCIHSKVGQTFHLQDTDWGKVIQYYRYVRPRFKSFEEAYKADLGFVWSCAKKEKKDFFEFDGSIYQTNESAFKQVEALIKARKAGKSKFIFNGEEKEACSFYEPSEQMAIFGNLWEEVISPQSPETKILLRKCAEQEAVGVGTIPFTLSRLYELCRISGYPEVKDACEDSSLVGFVIAKSTGKLNTYYSPATFERPTIYVAPDEKVKGFVYDDILCELPHAFRNNNNMFGETAQFIGDGLKDLLTFTSLGFGYNAQIKNYNNPNRMEYDAHKVIEPLIRAYIKTPEATLADLYHCIETIRTKNGNTYTLTPSARKKLKEKTTKKNVIHKIIFGHRYRIDRK